MKKKNCRHQQSFPKGLEIVIYEMFELLHSKLRQLSHSYSPNHSQYMPESNFKETNVKKERQRERNVHC